MGRALLRPTIVRLRRYTYTGTCDAYLYRFAPVECFAIEQPRPTGAKRLELPHFPRVIRKHLRCK